MFDKSQTLHFFIVRLRNVSILIALTIPYLSLNSPNYEKIRLPNPSITEL